jgi:hypothetical protein
MTFNEMTWAERAAWTLAFLLAPLIGTALGRKTVDYPPARPRRRHNAGLGDIGITTTHDQGNW